MACGTSGASFSPHALQHTAHRAMTIHVREETVPTELFVIA